MAIVILGGCADAVPLELVQRVDACPVPIADPSIRSLPDVNASITVPAGWEEWSGSTWVAFSSDPQQTVWVSIGRRDDLLPDQFPPIEGTEIGQTEVVFADGQVRPARVIDWIGNGGPNLSIEVVILDDEGTRVVRGTTPPLFAERCRALITQMFSTIELDLK